MSNSRGREGGFDRIAGTEKRFAIVCGSHAHRSWARAYPQEPASSGSASWEQRPAVAASLGPFGHTDVSTRGAWTIQLQWAGEDTLPAKGRNSNPKGAHLIFCKLKEPSLESEKEA